MNVIYSIGCSILDIKEFINLLKQFNISAIADIRSTPYSKYTPQFNAEVLSNSLGENGIRYLSFAKEFGARREDFKEYTNNKVDFTKVINTEAFDNGINRITKGIEKGFNIALMCTEKDPIECHRFSLVSRGLSLKTDLEIKHIHSNGNLETNKDLEKRLLEKYSIQPDLFLKDIMEEAYTLVNNEIGYTIQNEEKYD